MKKSSIIITVLCTLIVVGLLALLGGYFIYSSSLSPIQDESEKYIYVLEEGKRAKTVAKELEEQGVIKSGTFAYIYTRLNDKIDVKAGSYELDKSMSVEEIFDILNDPKGAISDEVLITIPEGKWASEIATIIGNKVECAKLDLMNVWNDADYIRSLMKEYPFLEEDCLNPDIVANGGCLLEGYLFPETYYIRKSASPESITKTFLDQTLKIYEAHKSEFDKSEFSVHEILTLASIVQYESGKDEDNAAIAQVFVNRLHNPKETGGKLQSNVTAQYAWGSRSVNTEFNENKYIDSPFNTYMVAGLPIGPVCNPGENAIEASLNPDKDYEGYYYFISDRKGVIHYAKTFEEHQKNDAKY